MLAEYLAQVWPLSGEEGDVVACELGAGLGLASLVCSKYCPVVATDHSHEVLRVLRQNCGLNPLIHPVR